LYNREIKVQHRCAACRAQYPTGFHPFCKACGGMVDVEYGLEELELPDSPNPYVRFSGLLPLTHLRDRMPAATYTPMIHAKRLGRELGMSSLYLKNETVLPTKSTKDRMATISLAYLRERGVRAFCASSTGNSATSFAFGIRAHPDMHLFLFTAEQFVPRVHHADHPQVTHFGMRDATFVEAAVYADRYARQHGLVSESGFFNPGRREGLKLAFLEASEQVPRPIDWYVQAVSSAMGVFGAYKGAKELLEIGRIERLPRLLCVQQETCAPMARAYADGSGTIRPEHIVTSPTGIAESILRGDPTRAYPYVRRIVIESGGGFVMVSEAEIRDARRRVEECEGISPCFSASAAVAGVTRLAREFSNDSVVVVNLTGSDRPQMQKPSNIVWIPRTSEGWNAPGPEILRSASPAGHHSPDSTPSDNSA
jgi:threonine synthase